MQRPHLSDWGDHHAELIDSVLAWLVVGLVVLFNVIMMWRIATATV